MVDRPPIVLVHGGRQGGWVWQRVIPRLTAAGHRVLAPTLTGVGERSHLLHRGLGLADHVTDLRAVLEYEDVRDAVLVGHSYGGMVLTEAVETGAVRQRVGRLVYLDALVPEPGDNAYDLMQPAITAALRRAVDADGDGWRVPARTGSGVFGLTDPDDERWAGERLTDQPARTYEDRLGGDRGARALPRCYIRFTDPAVIPEHVVDRARRDPAWHYDEVAAPHAAPLSHPTHVADALLCCAGHDA